jgi:membrane-associated phospholipid phosphatase
MKRPEPFWHWPGRDLLLHYLRLGAVVGAWFTLVYVGADWLTARHGWRVRVHLDLERHTPFVPAALLGYVSEYVLFALPPFVLGTRRDLDALAAALAAVILVAGVVFLLVPAAPAFPPPSERGVWEGPVRFFKWLALPHNLVPSLHVALSVACVTVYARRAGLPGKMLLWLWAGVIAASTLLLHQHYLLDVLTGAALGWAGARAVYDRWAACT